MASSYFPDNCSGDTLVINSCIGNRSLAFRMYGVGSFLCPHANRMPCYLPVQVHTVPVGNWAEMDGPFVNLHDQRMSSPIFVAELSLTFNAYRRPVSVI